MAEINRLAIFERGDYDPSNDYHRPKIENYLVNFAQTQPEKYLQLLDHYNQKAEKLGAEPFPRIKIVVDEPEAETPASVEEETPSEEGQQSANEPTDEPKDSEGDDQPEESLTLEQFEELGADEQRELLNKLVKGERTEGDDSNAEKRKALFLSTLE